ncbi:hypothetical protein K2Q08_02955 [Patescibacteria group bacterium]|nr:hypothetical protein [Patescibacteria group bacterium]
MTDRKSSNVHYLFPSQDVAEEKPTEPYQLFPEMRLEFDDSQLVAPYPTNQVADPELEKWASWLINFDREYARRG